MSNPFNKSEEKKESVQTAPVDRTPTVLLSQADAYIHERIKAQPKTRDEVDVKVEAKFDVNHHRLTIPKELDKFTNRYTFHWIFKREQAISEACDVKGWVICNRTHFPELPNHLFSVTGCVERGDLILGFMRKERAEKMRKAVGEESTERVKAKLSAHAGNPDFYVPDGDSSEDGKVIGL